MPLPRLLPRVRRACAAAAFVLFAGAACTPPPDAPTEKPVEPQSTQLRDAIREPLDTARDAQRTLDDNAARQRRAIEDAGG
ncbi:hypothetical protein PQS31_04415 [Luteimonas sp BLCC-B24]|uniref:hypothetical protein n=1 Tax=Luteimonas sp. BLCC-B24 TaxID=3025317 RepID=UPI00234C3A41|nr:hypothetical protein [Luteimonas sp. BLCC-B24]MDC7806067.1 hypothetical protein [Luteimonas sp. BLCC-B24]